MKNKNLENLHTLSTKIPINEGILPVDKPKNKHSFSLVAALRKLTGIQKIGHAGTLDPFASGVMILLIGKAYTRLSQELTAQEKEYLATLHLGVETDTYDLDGKVMHTHSHVPSFLEIEKAVAAFQGKITQIPPMFSAKKINGKRLYELARKGIEIERKPIEVHLQIELIRYAYPFLEIKVTCSKGTYIRSLAHDMGRYLGTGAHLAALIRTRSGSYHLDHCMDGHLLYADLQRTI